MTECISDSHEELILELVEGEQKGNTYRSFSDWYEQANMQLDEILRIIKERQEKRASE